MNCIKQLDRRALHCIALLDTTALHFVVLLDTTARPAKSTFYASKAWKRKFLKKCVKGGNFCSIIAVFSESENA